MASFLPPIAGPLTNVTVEAPTRGVLDVSGHRAVLVSKVSDSGSAKGVAPITSYATPRAVVGAFGGADFVELSPLPSSDEVAGVMRALGELGATMPTFYFGGPGLGQPQSGTVEVGDEIVSGQEILIGATLGPCALAPREWARVLLDAMTRANEPDLGPWTAFLAALADGPALYVLHHTGQPPAMGGLEFDVELANGATTVAAIDEAADLAAVVQGDLFEPGARVRLRTPAGGIPYHSAYASDLRSSPDEQATADERWFEPSRLPDGFGTLLCTDLDGWFGDRPAGVSLPRYHAGSHVEPLLDGNETFERLWADLLPLRPTDGGAPTGAADDTPYGIWMAGLMFKDFELIPGVPESKFVDLVKRMHADEVQVRLLAAKGFQFEGTESEEQRRLLAIALLLVVAGVGLGSVALEGIGMGASDETWTRLTLVAVVVAIAASPLFVDLIAEKLDFSKDVLDALETTPRIALWARYPARFSDNPSADYPASVIEQLVAVERTGWHHQKLQVLSLPGADATDPPSYVAYLGGIDINDNRVDSWAHRWPANYHDVHARVTGPAAADVFQNFYERYEDELGRRPAEEGPAAPNTCPRHSPRPGSGHGPTPSLSTIEPAGDDIVQVARTLYRPAPANAHEGFWYAPEGEASVHDSVLRAIQSAREYIYIEDQYMTPADSGGTGLEITEALQEAATRCKALILVFSQGTAEQLFGRERRNRLFERLQTSWNLPGRFFLPMIHTRQLLGAPDLVSSRGRTVLKSQLAATATQVQVSHGIRVPSAPCWAFIEGELVLVTDVDLDTATGDAALQVVRAPADSWPRLHEAGAPVTFTTLDDVFIHAKIVLVDDVYASIGSANMNRRAMFHDGEINAMLVPGRLRAAAENPVRSLRCRVWADHLGIPPHVAESVLADPLAALRLFMRSRAAGNPLSRFEPLEQVEPEGIAIQTGNAVQILTTVFTGLGQVTGQVAKEAIWRTLVDPTTSLDPFFDAPPFD